MKEEQYKDYNKKNYKKTIIVLFVVIFILLLCQFLLSTLSKEQKNNELSYSSLRSVKDVIEYYESTYISESESEETGYYLDIFLKFKVLPYDENDNSNETYYNTLIEEVAKVIRYKSFKMIDLENEITIKVVCENNKIESIIINDIEDYFIYMDSQISMKKYVEIKSTEFVINSPILQSCINNNWDNNINFGTRESIFDEYYIYLALYNFKISNIITLFEKRLTENIYISVEPKLMDNEYMKATNAIKKQFRKLQQRFYTDNKIDATKVTEPLEYNCSLKEFYKQLLMIDKKYGLKAQISQRLTKEIEEYKAVPDYNTFITALSFIKNSYYEKIVSNATLLKAYKQDENNLEIARLILQMHKQIREYIKQYHYLKNQIISLESTINAIGDIEIEFKYLELKNNLVFATNLDEIFKKLNTLKNSIRHYELQSTYQRVRAI